MPGFNITGDSANLPSNKVETHRVHRWLIEDFGFPQNVSSGTGGTRTRSNPSIADQGNLKIYAKSVLLPVVGFETGMAPGASIDYPYASKATFEPVTISFYDVYGIYDLFNKWREAIWTPEEGIKQLDGYVGEPVFVQYDGQGNPIERFRLRNAFPKNISKSELTYDSTDICLVKVQFIYSHFEFEFPKESPESF